MTIAYGYTISLNCDVETHERVIMRNASFSGENKLQAVREAKRAGWSVFFTINKARCPHCTARLKGGG